jgi:MoaA/NifB/PqqE/SkfB family radical SAM enzyme
MTKKIIPPPLLVQYELTTKCNLLCNMCYNGSGGSNDRSGELTKEEWIKIITETAQMGILEAIISGGEPLSMGHQFIIDIVNILSSHNIAITLLSNGWYINDSFVKQVKHSKFNRVQISIDAPTAEMHDKIRGVKGSFVQAVNAAHAFANQGVKVRISCVIQKINRHVAQEMCELAIAIGASELALDELMPIGRGLGNFDEIGLPEDTRSKLLEEIDFLRQSYNPFLSILEGFQRRSQLDLLSSVDVTESIVIRPDGELRLNCMAPFSVGNVRDGFQKAWSKALNAWQQPELCNYVNSVTDNHSLKDVYCELGIIEGQENVQIS